MNHITACSATDTLREFRCSQCINRQ